MNRLAAAIKAASSDALLVANLESMASDMTREVVSMEQHFDDLTDYVTLANGLEMAVVSVESFTDPTFSQYSQARSQAVSLLKLSGLNDREVIEIFPSLESENPTSAWEKFKAFLVKLWNFIAEAAKKVYQFIDAVLKKSSLAEKAAMMQLRRLRAEVASRRNGLTIDPQIKLRPAHRYLLPPNGSGNLTDLNQLVRTIQKFRETRDLLQVKMPEIIMKVVRDLIQAVDNLALGGTDEEISQSIAANAEAIRKAVEPMFPSGLQATLGVSSYTLPLIYDRVLTIHEPTASPDNDLKEYIGQLGISVDQAQHSTNPEEMGTFPALRTNDIERLLNLAGELINESHSADQSRTWQKLKTFSTSLGMDIDNVLKVILRKQGLTVEAQATLKLALNARQVMNKWISAPFMQINTVNIRVVESLLALAFDQIKNYELKDSMQERVDKKVEEEKKQKASSDAQKPKPKQKPTA